METSAWETSVVSRLKKLNCCLTVFFFFFFWSVVAAIGIVSVENGVNGAGNVIGKRSGVSGGELAHAKGGDVRGHVSVKGQLLHPQRSLEFGAETGRETGREVKPKSSHVKEAESGTGTENARGGAGAGRGGGTGREGRVQREVKRAQAV